MPYPGNLAYRAGERAAAGLSNAVVLQFPDMIGATNAARAAAKAAPWRLLTRFFPWLGVFYLAWEFGRFLAMVKAQLHANWSVTCTGPGQEIDSALSCGNLFSQIPGTFSPVTTTTSSVNTVYPLFPQSGGLTRYRTTGKAVKTGVAPAWNKRFTSWKYTMPAQEPWSTPWELPINNPAPNFPPVPYPVIPHWPGNPTDPHPVPRPAPRPLPGPQPGTQPGPSPGVVPGVPSAPSPPRTPERPRTRPRFNPRRAFRRGRNEPAIVPELVPQIITRTNNSPVRRRPGKRTVETKVRGIGLVGSLLWKLANGITEAKDFAEPFYDAMPHRYKEYQVKRTPEKGRIFGRAKPPLPRQMELVADYWQSHRRYMDRAKARGDQAEVDRLSGEWDAYMSRVIDGQVANQIADYIAGKFGKALGQASRVQRRPIGFGAGPTH